MIVNQSADSVLLAIGDTTSTITFFNGDDAIALFHGSDSIDIIGVIGEDPGSNWTVGAGATSEFTLVRSAVVRQGQLDWAVGATEWEVFPQNDFSHFGSHTILPCDEVIPIIGFATSGQTANEDAGTLTIEVTISEAPTSPVDVMVTLNAGSSTATDVDDFTFMPQTLTFPADTNLSQTFDVTIIDDAASEVVESIVLELTLAVPDSAVLGADMHTISIIDNDTAKMNIADVHVETATGVAESDGLGVVLCGIVHGCNLSTDDLRFTLIDHTGGINVFGQDGNFGYTPTAGDSIVVSGTIDQFNGLTEIIPDTVILISSGNDLYGPDVVTMLDETTESKYITLENMSFVDESQWTGGGVSFNVDITNGVDTFQMRIDDDTYWPNQSIPDYDMFKVHGVGGQFDNSEPYDGNYQIFPCEESDIEEIVGIEDFERVNFTIYPNPATDVLFVEANSRMELVQVFNSAGQKVLSRPLVSTTANLQVSNFIAGVYTIVITTENGIQAMNWIKE